MYICVIGGSNIDIQGRPKSQLIARDSNIGTVKISFGGVGRNIAENLARMGLDTRLISVLGDDVDGRRIMDEARLIGLDMSDSLVLSGAMSSVYLCILDEKNDMALAINSMDIYESMSTEFIEGKRQVIENAALCILDTNIPAEVLAYIAASFQNTVFFLDPVSTVKALKVKDLIGRFHTIKPNRLEAEALCGISIHDESDMKKAAAFFHQQGVRQVFITLGSEGVFYSTPAESGRVRAPDTIISNASGAGDAFVAAVALGYLRGMGARECALLASAASAIAMSHEDTINPAMTPEALFDKLKELALC